MSEPVSIFTSEARQEYQRRLKALVEVGNAIYQAEKAEQTLQQWLSAARQRARKAHDEGAGVDEIARAAGVGTPIVREWVL
jgi:hypothetical protein